jgi:hypothetical protein
MLYTKIGYLYLLIPGNPINGVLELTEAIFFVHLKPVFNQKDEGKSCEYI